jgi:hypothetical protein
MRDARRESERIQILGGLPGTATVHQSVLVTELSRGGAQIETTFPLLLNSVHEFRLPLGSRTVVVKGRVAHCQIQDVESDSIVYRAGIECVDMPDWVSGAMGDFLESIKEGREA